MSDKNNNRILSNTLALYVRQVVVLLVSLYTVRVVLIELGVEGYGVYSAVAGLVAMGAFLSTSLAQAAQRNFSFALGEGDTEKLNKTFTANLFIFVSIAFLAFLILQTGGRWFVAHHMEFPEGRASTGVVVFTCSSFAFVATILTSPFVASLIAHEDMRIYAYLSVFEALLKLGLVFLLKYSTFDKLETYGFLLMCVAYLNFFAYLLICAKRYVEVQFTRLYWDVDLVRQVLSFTGWTVFGQMTTMARTHAITVLLNQSFNPTVVAARAISMQVINAVNSFTGSFSTALYPPIIKTYSVGDLEQMYRLVSIGARLTFFLLWIFALPLMLEIEAVFAVWLDEVPPDAVLFARLGFVEALIFSISMPLTAAARAPGKMKAYELILGGIQVAIFFVAWGVISLGYPPSSVFIVAIVANLLMFGIRLYLVNWLTGLPIFPFIRFTVLPVLLIVIVTATPAAFFNSIVSDSLWGSAFVILICGILSVVAMYFIGLDKALREKLLSIISSRLQSFRLKRA